MIDAAQFFDTEDATALAGGRQTETAVCAWQPIILDVGDDPDPIPPRGWLLGTAFCREFVSSILAAGATGKTALRVVQMLALATGCPLTGEYVFIRCRDADRPGGQHSRAAEAGARRNAPLRHHIRRCSRLVLHRRLTPPARISRTSKAYAVTHSLVEGWPSG